MNRRGADLGALFAALALLGFGIVMVFSASSVEALADYHNAYYYLERQVIWAGLGLVGMVYLMRLDYHQWRAWAIPLFGLTLLLLVAVLLPGVGRVVNGSRRWLGVSSLGFQPSELSKLSLVLLFAVTLTRTKPQRLRDIRRGLLPHLLVLIIAFALILGEPDLGTAIALAGTAAVMFFVGGIPWWQLAEVGGVGIPAVLAAIFLSPYRRDRFLAFLDPEKNPLGSGYHILQSLYALGSGGLFGTGLGRSSLKYFYLPERHTDFIFAIIGEELGFLGGLVVLVLFVVLAWRGYKIALEAPDALGTVLAVGLTTMILLQAIINIGVVTASMPITGIPLPFVSYGGSSLVFTLMGVGILLSISRGGRRWE